MTLSDFSQYETIKVKNDVVIATYRQILWRTPHKANFATTPINITPFLVFYKDMSLDSIHSKQMIFKANNKSTKKKWKDLPKVNRNVQATWQTLLWYHCRQTDLTLDIPLTFKNVRRRKWSTRNANLKYTRDRYSTP